MFPALTQTVVGQCTQEMNNVEQECHLPNPSSGEEARSRARREKPKGDKMGNCLQRTCGCLMRLTPCRAGSFPKGKVGVLLKARGFRDSNTFPIREGTMPVLGLYLMEVTQTRR